MEDYEGDRSGDELISSAIVRVDSILSRLDYFVKHSPTKLLWRYVDESGATYKALTYEQVDQCSSLIASNILKSGKAKRGDRVGLVFLPGPDFIMTFVACLKAGLIAVPAYPPDPRRLKYQLLAFSSIMRRSGCSIALSHSAYLGAKRLAELQQAASSLLSVFGNGATGMEWPDLEWISVDSWISSGEKLQGGKDIAGLPRDFAPSEVAFLQFTSGSTSEPKGVMITHGSLSHNLGSIMRTMNASSETRVAGWLPQYHDMGLIGSTLGPMYCGGSGVYCSPLSFVGDPPLWIRMIAQTRATHVQSPNFGYLLAARKFTERGGSTAAEQVLRRQAQRPSHPAEALPEDDGHPLISMHSLAFALNAAEPVTADALDAFAAVAEPLGFQPIAMQPSFGMAESTVYVCDGGGMRAKVTRASLQEGKRAAVQGFRHRRSDGSLGDWVQATTADEAAPEDEAAIGMEGPAQPQSSGGTDAATGASSAERAADTEASAGKGEGFGEPLQILVSCGDIERNADLGFAMAIVDPKSGRVLDRNSAASEPPVALDLVRGDIVEPERIRREETASDASAAVASGKEESEAAPEQSGRIGELWLASPSVAAGYWGDESKTKSAFHAKAGSSLDTPQEQLAEMGGSTDAKGPASGAGADGADDDGDSAANVASASRADSYRHDEDAHGEDEEGDALLGSHPDRVWMRTGDLGFMRRGYLFITGRMKDMLIVRGKNYYPQDVEGAAESVGSTVGEGGMRTPGHLRPGCTAAFAVPTRVLRGTLETLGLGSAASAAAALEAEQPDALVIVGELRDALPSSRTEKVRVLREKTGQIAASVMDLHGIKPQLVLLLKKHNVRKTTSGKIARTWNKRALWDLAENKTDGPWHRSKKAIVFAAPFVEESSGGEPGARAGSGGGSQAESSGAGEQPGSAAAKPSQAGPPPHDPEQRASATGTVLLELLQWDLAKILDVVPSKIPQHAGLAAMGLESAQLARFRGVLRLDYGVRRVSEEGMYAGGFTLHWIAREIEELRGDGEAVEPPAEPDKSGSLDPAPQLGRDVSLCERYFPCCVCFYEEPKP